ncbi:chloride channel protein [Geminicoccaceae bacterium 1502E]|nr:chloride channel protein [Geminicoccaceae bacterium 1502E]
MRPQAEPRRITLVELCLLAVAVGVVTGLGAAAFRVLVLALYNLFFHGSLSLEHDPNAFGPPSAWGALVILVPVVGGLLVVWIINRFAPEARGAGVAQVMHAIYYEGGRIRPQVALTKIVASALSIGSGASVGREGPMVQIGSGFGSTIGGLLPLEPWQRITLVAAGAGAGIAATFNTPLAAVLFAVELLLPEVSPRTFLPVVIATGVATHLGRLLFGAQPAFTLTGLAPPGFEDVHFLSLLSVALFGLLSGLGAGLYVLALRFMQQRFDGLPLGPYARNALGMLMVGVLLYGVFKLTGQYHIHGVGTATVEAVMTGGLGEPVLLFALFALKLLATTVSLGAGASGGVFGPALFMGATLGGAYGAAIIALTGFEDLGVGEYAMIGMASFAGGATGAAMTTIVMIFEMVRNYHVVFPAIIATAIAIGFCRLLSKENVYTVNLAARGRNIPQERHSNMFLVRHAEEVMSRSVVVLPAKAHLQDGLAALPASEDSQYVVVADGPRIAGVLLLTPSLRALEDVHGTVTLGEIADRSFTLAPPGMSMFDVFRRMGRRKARYVLVIQGGGVPRPEKVRGVIARAQITDAVVDTFAA